MTSFRSVSIFASFSAAMLLATSAWAQVKIENPWVRTTVAQQKATGAFMQISSGDNRKLVAVSTPVAGIAEVHQMSMENNVMKMRPVEGGLDIPSGKTVELKPGGYHIMLMDLKAQIKEGDDVPLKLTFEGADKKTSIVDVHAKAQAMAPAANAQHQHH